MSISRFITSNSIMFKSHKCHNVNCQNVGKALVVIRPNSRDGQAQLGNFLWLCFNCERCATVGEHKDGWKVRGRWQWLRETLEAMQRLSLQDTNKQTDLRYVEDFFWRDALCWLREEAKREQFRR